MSFGCIPHSTEHPGAVKLILIKASGVLPKIIKQFWKNSTYISACNPFSFFYPQCISTLEEDTLLDPNSKKLKWKMC